MREASGSTLLLQIMMVFISIYIAFMAVTINYSKTFRVKNRIISMIEKNEGPDLTKISDYLNNTAYYHNDWDVCREPTSRGPYYQVTTYVDFKIPLTNNKLKFKIKGETKVLYSSRDNKSKTCNNS
ncbi:MAG: hypothetical protein RR359_01340 [Bacilli bacterium]